MIIGIVGPAGVGRGIAADYLSRKIDGAQVRPIEEFPDVLDPGKARPAFTIVPDVRSNAQASLVRALGGHIIFMWGRRSSLPGRYETAPASVEMDKRDWLIANTGGPDDLYRSLDGVARVINRERDGMRQC